MITLSFVPCRPGYQLTKTATNSVIKKLFKIVLVRAFVTYRGVEPFFQQVPFIDLQTNRHVMSNFNRRVVSKMEHQKGVTKRVPVLGSETRNRSRWLLSGMGCLRQRRALGLFIPGRAI